MDPICTLFFAVLVFTITVPLIYQAFYVLMDTVPKSIDMSELLSTIRQIRNVNSVRDFHVWNVGYSDVALTALLHVSDEERGNNCHCAIRSKISMEVREIARSR